MWPFISVTFSFCHVCTLLLYANIWAVMTRCQLKNVLSRGCQLCVSGASYCIYSRCECVINDADHRSPRVSPRRAPPRSARSLEEPRSQLRFFNSHIWNLAVWHSPAPNLQTVLSNCTLLFARKLEYSRNWTFLIIFFMALLKLVSLQVLIDVM